ncbi:MAG TPA: LysR substrate-binding domain-containing protein [Azospira sp.]|nr:LysR substrate-binding domain-containing protein [Azospira sp.]
MDLSDLHIFSTVAREGGITKAAARLNRVQSNVTTRIRQLEENLAVELFVREGKRLQLSPAGRLLLVYADRLLDLAEEARNAVQGATPRGRLRLGSMESTAAVRLPGPLAEFHQRHPAVQLELSTGDTRGLVAQVLSGELDAALVAEPVDDPRLEKQVLFAEELVIVTEAAQPPVHSARDLEHRTLVSFAPGCAYRKRLEDWFAQDGLLPERVVEVSSYHAILGCLVAGMGVALLPRSVLQTAAGASLLRCHPLADGQHVNTVALWRRGAATPAVNALVELLAAAGQQQPLPQAA